MEGNGGGNNSPCNLLIYLPDKNNPKVNLQTPV